MYPIIPIEINGKRTYSILWGGIADFSVHDFQPEDVEKMAEYAPAKIIISRESFTSDTAMINAKYILQHKQIGFKLF